MKKDPSRLMPRKSIVLAASAALTMLPLLAHPHDADARAGGGMSMGSRGSRTYSAPAPSATAPMGAMPFQRTMTPRQPDAGYGARAPFGAGAGSMAMARPRHPFMSGFMGGLIGAGLFGMVFGHGMFGSGMGGSGFLGLLIQLALVFFLVRWAIRRFSGSGTGGGTLNPFASGGAGPTGGPVPQGSTQPVGVAITAADYQAFQQALINIQTAWSQQNVAAMQHMATPEMVSYFNNQLSDLASRGARNVVSDVRFERGDLVESWRENGMDYATVAMQYSLIDITTDMTGRVIDGDPSNRTTVSELWTFVRSAGTGTWLLSAIQQTRR
ncbi:Tim44 domain-containing protein [Komagataeibacter medellinensis]|uniref:Mitochondrial import inner membrane translocase subunit n=1 Tax=Komagataeibacter medellinensis (strain NBRC 3288 / BCRC 11682 / LMG 1693 / Kondo 51) TaxID=634177 RepID=G2I2Q6_KOMMN|nr:TIM44-like domain-containing protein [Komagataeibacter medellinensis]BAK85035.1 mitochondrial import inner membrane translocase subunit [Komagataeibacter medellinensis NBRC 3288]